MCKAVLVIDMPRVCSECDLFKNYYDDEHENWYYACALLEKTIDSDIAEEKRCDGCPLKPLPEKKEEIELPKFVGETKGSINQFSTKNFKTLIKYAKNTSWNECIDEIIGEEK